MTIAESPICDGVHPTRFPYCWVDSAPLWQWPFQNCANEDQVAVNTLPSHSLDCSKKSHVSQIIHRFINTDWRKMTRTRDLGASFRQIQPAPSRADIFPASPASSTRSVHVPTWMNGTSTGLIKRSKAVAQACHVCRHNKAKVMTLLQTSMRPLTTVAGAV